MNFVQKKGNPCLNSSLLNKESVRKNLLFIVLMFPFFFSSCEKADIVSNQVAPTQQGQTVGIYILSEGLFNMNNSTLAYYDVKAGTLNTDYFNFINKRGLGDTANDMELYGSKLYIVVDVSSQVEVLDAKTGVSLKEIPMFNQNGASRQPRYIAFFKNKAYVASFDGTVSRIDTATMTVDSIVTVGANPDGICVANNKLYVSNSGGLNAPNYGNTVSVIDINTFTQIKQIQVGLNPSKILADSEGDVFLCSLGNYGNVPYTFQMINSQTDQLAQTFSNINALDFTIHNDTAYIYNCDYQNNTNWIKVFDCKTQTIVSQSFITDGTTLQTPYGINVNPQNGDVYITDAGSFVTSGDLYWFSSKGKLKGKLANVGLNPSSIVFIQN